MFWILFLFFLLIIVLWFKEKELHFLSGSPFIVWGCNEEGKRNVVDPCKNNKRVIIHDFDKGISIERNISEGTVSVKNENSDVIGMLNFSGIDSRSFSSQFSSQEDSGKLALRELKISKKRI